MPRTAALEVPKGALVQPFFSVRLVNDVAALANWAPSSEVKHWALEKLLPSACTLTTPLGAMSSRPLVALHRSTGMNTLVAGRNAFGRVNGTALVPEVAIAPLKWTITETLVKPFLRVSGVSVIACAAPVLRRGSMTAAAHNAPVATCRSLFTSPHFLCASRGPAPA